MLADVALVVKITGLLLLLPNVQNPQLEPKGITITTRGYSLVPVLRLHMYVNGMVSSQEEISTTCN